jgi:hypothetical protein
VGDVIPDGPPARLYDFRIERLAMSTALVLHSTTHVPHVANDPARTSTGAGRSAGTVGDDGSRLAFRTRATIRPWWMRLAYVVALVPADHVMSRQMLRGIRDRAERRPR